MWRHKSSGGEDLWLEQWSWNSFSNSNISPHTPYPNDFQRNGFLSSGDFIMEIETFLKRDISSRTVGFTWIKMYVPQHMFIWFINNVFTNQTDRSALDWFWISRRLCSCIKFKLIRWRTAIGWVTGYTVRGFLLSCTSSPVSVNILLQISATTWMWLTI